MNRISRCGKGIVALLTMLFTLNLFCVPALAENTEIYTIVPDKHTISIEIGSGGAVIDQNGIVHIEGYTVEVAHNERLYLVLRPDSGYQLHSVLLDGQDRKASISGGRLEIGNICQDSKLRVSFVKASAPVGKTYRIVGTVTENGNPARGITLELRSKLKTFVTGNDGKFRFDKVEPGAHSLTALRDGKVVGYLTFLLDEGGEGVNIKKLPDGTFQLTVDGNVATLELAVSMKRDGTMEIIKAEAITEKKAEENYPPDTGDDTQMLGWLGAMLSTGVLVLLLLRKRKKSEYTA